MNMPLSQTKTLLHVGAGTASDARLPAQFRGWHEIRVDIDPETRPDLVAPMTHMPAVQAGGVDAIWCSHSLEHLSAFEVQPTLKEWLRVLRPDGIALIAVPDLTQAARLIAAGKEEVTIYSSPAGPVTALDMVFGHGPSIQHGQPYMRHGTGFTATRLRRVFAEAGFHQTDVWTEGLNLFGVSYRSQAAWSAYHSRFAAAQRPPAPQSSHAPAPRQNVDWEAMSSL
ncbi:MAG: class I SAM-dependent methyltransferase [Pseudomonadota bacterium]